MTLTTLEEVRGAAEPAPRLRVRERAVTGDPRHRERRRARWGWIAWCALFLAPAILLLLGTRVLPGLWALSSSLTHESPLRTDGTFPSIANFVSLFGSFGFLQTLVQTLLFVLLVSPAIVIGSLALAYMLTRGFPGTRLWRTIAYLPSAVPTLGLTVMWGIAFRPDGPVNAVLATVGLPAQGFYTSTSQALFTIGLFTAWTGVGYWMIFLIAGMNDIPEEYYEAARIDGAGKIRQYFSITLPLLRKQVLFVLVANTAWVFTIYAPIAILTRGGPEGSSRMLMYDIVERANTFSNNGQAMAEMTLLLVIMVVVVSVQFALMTGKRDT